MSTSLATSCKWPRAMRLTHAKEFRTVVQLGRTLHSSFLRLSYLTVERKDMGCSRHGTNFRVGLVVSRKVGGAVIRNRLRRRLREIFRRVLPKNSSSQWIVVIAKYGAGAAAFSDLEGECLSLAQRLSLILLPSS